MSKSECRKEIIISPKKFDSITESFAFFRHLDFDIRHSYALISAPNTPSTPRENAFHAAFFAPSACCPDAESL